MTVIGDDSEEPHPAPGYNLRNHCHLHYITVVRRALAKVVIEINLLLIKMVTL